MPSNRSISHATPIRKSRALTILLIFAAWIISGLSSVHASETIAYYHLDAQGSPIGT